MRKACGVILFLLATVLGAQAQYYAVNGACTLGGQAVIMQGMASSGTRPLRGGSTFPNTGVMASYPGCTVMVVLTGTSTPATLYLSSTGGTLSNPFTANLTDGSFVFYAAAACYDITISSGATQASTMPTPHSFAAVCAGAGGGGGGGGGGTGGGMTVNSVAVTGVPNLNDSIPPPVPYGLNVRWQLSQGNQISAQFVGDGNASHFFNGAGQFVPLPGGTGGGVTSINGTAGAFTFTGAGQSCSGTTCTFSGGGATLPTTPAYDLFSSNGSGTAQTSGVLGNSGFAQAGVLTAIGASGTDPFNVPNASVEWFPTGAYNISAPNGAAFFFGHGSGATSATNAGVVLAGGNTTATTAQPNQAYLACFPTGCDFKVAPTYLGNAIGGGPSGSGTVSSGTINQFAIYTGSTTVSSNPHLDDGLTAASTITSTEPVTAPQLNLVGAGGAALTSSGGALPAPAPNVGGFGIGAGGQPQISVSGGAWTNIGAGVTSFNTRTGPVMPAAGDYNVAEVTGAAPLASPAFTGTPTAPTPSATDNSTSIATTAWVTAHGGSSGGAPLTITRGAMTPFCISSAGPSGSVSITPVTLNVGDTVMVAIAVNGNNSAATWTIGDTTANFYSDLGQHQGGTTMQTVVFYSHNIANAVSGGTITVSSSVLSGRMVGCVATYRNVGALGTTPNGLVGHLVTGVTGDSLTLPSVLTGSFGFFVFGSIANQSYTVTGPATASLAGQTANAGGVGLLACENTAVVSGSVGCTMTQSVSSISAAIGVELQAELGPSTPSVPWPTAAGIAVYSGNNSWSPSYNTSTPIPVTFLPATLTQSTSGNAGTATQLAATPTTCLSGQFAQGVLANGNATGCASPGGGTTTNALTFASTGGGATGSTFNGSAALIVSPITIGAAPLAGPTFTGTVTTPSISDIGTQVTVTPPLYLGNIVTPVTGIIVAAEGPAPAGQTNYDLLWADNSSVNHRWRMFNNNSGYGANNVVGEGMPNTFATGVTQSFYGPVMHLGEASLTTASTPAYPVTVSTPEAVVVKSAQQLPNSRFRQGQIIRVTWIGTCTSTAANTSTFSVRMGTTGSPSDTIVLASAITAAAAASGTSVPFRAVMEITVQSVGATGATYGTLTLENGGTTGIATTPVQVINSGPNTVNTQTVANYYLDALYVSATGTTATFNQAFIEMVYQ